MHSSSCADESREQTKAGSNGAFWGQNVSFCSKISFVLFTLSAPYTRWMTCFGDIQSGQKTKTKTKTGDANRYKSFEILALVYANMAKYGVF
jgi:hypothetical protein